MRPIRALAGLLLISGVALYFVPDGRADDKPPGDAAAPQATAPAKPKEDLNDAINGLIAEREGLRHKLERVQRRAEAAQQQVAELRERVADLERKLAKRPALQMPPLPPLKLQPGLSATPAVPKNAVPREFNGETYYVVPLISGNGTVVHGENQIGPPASKLPVTQPGR